MNIKQGDIIEYCDGLFEVEDNHGHCGIVLEVNDKHERTGTMISNFY